MMRFAQREPGGLFLPPLLAESPVCWYGPPSGTCSTCEEEQAPCDFLKVNEGGVSRYAAPSTSPTYGPLLSFQSTAGPTYPELVAYDGSWNYGRSGVSSIGFHTYDDAAILIGDVQANEGFQFVEGFFTAAALSAVRVIAAFSSINDHLYVEGVAPANASSSGTLRIGEVSGGVDTVLESTTVPVGLWSGTAPKQVFRLAICVRQNLEVVGLLAPNLHAGNITFHDPVPLPTTVNAPSPRRLTIKSTLGGTPTGTKAGIGTGNSSGSNDVHCSQFNGWRQSSNCNDCLACNCPSIPSNDLLSPNGRSQVLMSLARNATPMPSEWNPLLALVGNYVLEPVELSYGNSCTWRYILPSPIALPGLPDVIDEVREVFLHVFGGGGIGIAFGGPPAVGVPTAYGWVIRLGGTYSAGPGCPNTPSTHNAATFGSYASTYFTATITGITN